LTDFHNSFTDTFSRKRAIKLLIKISPHLKCVATLPCEMLMFANRATFCQSLMVSVGVSKLGCTHSIFVDPGVNINGWYLLYGRCLATSSCYKTVHRRTGHMRQSSCCNGKRPHSSHQICGLRIAQISTQ